MEFFNWSSAISLTPDTKGKERLIMNVNSISDWRILTLRRIHFPTSWETLQKRFQLWYPKLLPNRVTKTKYNGNLSAIKKHLKRRTKLPNTSFWWEKWNWEHRNTKRGPFYKKNQYEHLTCELYKNKSCYELVCFVNWITYFFCPKRSVPT